MKLLSVLTTLLLGVSAFARAPIHPGKISGQVRDAAAQPVAYANVVLLRAADSTLMKGGLTEADGRFTLENIPEGRYLVRVTQVGYQRLTTPTFVVNAENPEVRFVELAMTEAARTLGEVAVRAQKPFIERQLDKTIVNVENSIVAAGSSVLDVLERSPGVTVDQDGRLSLKGKPGVIVFIDGKPTQLSALDLANLLKGMPAGSIEKIELITNPSAKYDAAGNAGIIDIRTKKDQRRGFNGSATGSYGRGVYAKAAAGLNLNYRDRKWNYFGNYNYSYRKIMSNLDLDRRFSQGKQLVSRYVQANRFVVPFNTHTAKIGMDFSPNRRTTVGLVLSGLSNGIRRDGRNDTEVTDGLGQPTGRLRTINNSYDQWNNAALNLNFRRQLDSAGRELTADLDYARYDNSSRQRFTTDYFNAAGTPARTMGLIGDLGGYLDIRSFKIDYVHPLDKKSKIEAGLKASFVTNDNDVRFFVAEGGLTAFDTTRSNHFIYHENINAAYLNLNREIGKFSFQFGLRAEQTRADGNQVTMGTTFSRNYVQLFPSLFLSQKLGKKHELSYSLSRRIDRPSYQQLNPFTFFIDPTTNRRGNPFLLPQLTYAMEVTHTFDQRISTTLAYSRTTNNLTNVLLQNDSTRVTTQTDRNLAIFDYIGLSVNAPAQLAKWWNSNTSVNAYVGTYRGTIANTPLNAGAPTFNLNTQHTFTLPRGFSAELGLFYRFREVYGISVIEPLYNLSAGVQKSIWARKGTLRLNMTDIAWRNYPRGGTDFANINETFSALRDTRVATLALTYRFGKETVAPARRRRTGAEDELNRVRMGNG